MYLAKGPCSSLRGPPPPWVSGRNVCSFSQTAADDEANPLAAKWNRHASLLTSNRFYVKLKCWPTLVTVMWSDIMRHGWNMLQQILLVLLCPVSDPFVLVYISWRLSQHTIQCSRWKYVIYDSPRWKGEFWLLYWAVQIVQNVPQKMLLNVECL